MGTDTLTEWDRQLLRGLSTGPQTPRELAESVDHDPEPLADRLDVLAESGVVRQTDRTYELTDSGRRVLAAPGDGSADERIDIPVAVERELGSRDVDEPCTAAVRAAYAFLQYWGEATESELRDAVFSERPAGYDDRHQWWDDCVEPIFGQLPAVQPPEEVDSPAARWHYERPPGVDDATDGRAVLGSTESQPFGNARQAIEAQADSVDHRTAVRHTFGHLETHGYAAAGMLAELIAEVTDADSRESQAAVREMLAAVPSVVEVDGGWRYQHATGR